MAEEKQTYTRRPFPGNAVEECLTLAQAIQDSNNGRPMNRLLLADAIGRKPASSQYKELLSSSFKYGLTIGNEKSDTIALSELGAAITRPREPAERASALRKAVMSPELFRRIFDHYSNGKLPQGPFFLNVLERDFGVPRDRAQECADTLVSNGRVAGLIRELKGSLYVVTEADMDGEELGPELGIRENGAAAAETEDLEEVPSPAAATTQPNAEDSAERHIFVGHGKNRTPLEQLEKVLHQFKIPFKVAIDEPQLARPISTKVAQTMRECQSAILIFTADQQLRTEAGDLISRPSENVIYELGAASVLYENRIVIFKEEGVEFPTNFKDIGYISFEKDRLDAKGLDLVKELIGLGLIRVQAA